MGSWVPIKSPRKPANGIGSTEGRLASKAYEIEELADRYFFRPAGMVFALAARALGITPTGVTLIAALIGVIGGALLSSSALARVGFAVLIAHGVLDSSDGQLARMTGQSSEFGRLLDGVAGYVTHIAIYGGILTSAFSRGAGWRLVAVAIGAGLANIVHAQMYDYHRTTYTAIAIQGVPTSATAGTSRSGVIRIYEAMARALAGAHPLVEHAVAMRASAGRVTDADRARYRACFYAPVRGWNLLGDNTRFYAIGVCAWLQHVEWFFLFVLVPMNVAWLALWRWQARADQQFLRVM